MAKAEGEKGRKAVTTQLRRDRPCFRLVRGHCFRNYLTHASHDQFQFAKKAQSAEGEKSRAARRNLSSSFVVVDIRRDILVSSFQFYFFSLFLSLFISSQFLLFPFPLVLKQISLKDNSFLSFLFFIDRAQLYSESFLSRLYRFYNVVRYLFYAKQGWIFV